MVGSRGPLRPEPLRPEIVNQSNRLERNRQFSISFTRSDSAITRSKKFS